MKNDSCYQGYINFTVCLEFILFDLFADLIFFNLILLIFFEIEPRVANR